MALTKKERDQLAKQIQKENELVLRVGRIVRMSAIVFLACVLLCFWGFTGMVDPLLPNIPMSVRTIVKWIALACAVVSGVLMVLSFLSHRNGKKSVLAKIERFQKHA